MVTQIASDTQPGGTSDYVNVFAQDAYRDLSGHVHVLYTVQGPDTHQVITGHHAILANGTVTKEVSVADGYCPNEARIVQDATGRFYVLSQCGGRSLTWWLAGTADGTSLHMRRELRLQTRLSTYDYLATPRAGTEVADYLDLVYPASHGRLIYVRVQLAAR
jgi:hypothetical protein